MTFTRSQSDSRPGHQLILLAPDGARFPERFREATVCGKRYDSLLGAMQKLRGSIYLQDGAIQPNQLEIDGRHVVRADLDSWHVLSLDANGKVAGCSRYHSHQSGVTFNELTVSQAAIASDPELGLSFRKAIEAEIGHARRSQIGFVEVGGWAVHQKLRFTTEALRVALSTYALAWGLGDCISITTATVRNCSSRILRKLGGAPLSLNGASIPAYFDPQYGCEMEVLRFDSRRPDSRFLSWIEPIFQQLASAQVVCRTRDAAPLHSAVLAPVAGWNYVARRA